MIRVDRVFLIALVAALPGLASAPAATLGAPAVSVAASSGEPKESAPVGGEPSAKAPESSPAQIRRQRLDELFTRLAASTDATETGGIVLAINRLQLESGSSTGNLLMARAIGALETHNFDASLALLDKIIVLQPGWAEAWNKRATVRHLAADDEGSMTDIAHVLALEPRHFGALSGLGMILESRGFRDDALRAYRRALEIAPQLKSLRDAVARLTAEVDGQRL